MTDERTNDESSRRDFLEASAAGAIGLSTTLLTSSSMAADKSREASPGNLKLISGRSISKGSTGDLHLRFQSDLDLKPGAALWLFFDIRQGAGAAQTKDSSGNNFLSVAIGNTNAASDKIDAPTTRAWGIRTFDLLPVTPEFLHLIELNLEGGIAEGQTVDFTIKRWSSPEQPIDPFQFWLVVDPNAAWKFERTGYKSYRNFVHRQSEERIDTKTLLAQTVNASVQVTGDYLPVPAINHRKTPGIFWGEFHGMVFNQRPLDDYYNYARNVTKLDFCAPMWFSYNTCVDSVWGEVKAASRRFNEPGQFAAIAAVEMGTPPDGSHRCVLFRDPEKVPPIFCDDRPPAVEAIFQKRFHPDTIICKTVDELYETVSKYGGMITGHFHTKQYHAEVLCEMFQKNLVDPAAEEQRLYKLLREGKRFALAGTSDTHDSMPGNPRPEPHLPMAAGFTGVHAEELTVDALFDAVMARCIYATSGARIVMNFHCGESPMGAELKLDAKRQFQIEIDGTAKLQLVELLRDGHPIHTWSPGKSEFSVVADDTVADPSRTAFYLVRVTQEDQHKGWTSPIWFG